MDEENERLDLVMLMHALDYELKPLIQGRALYKISSAIHGDGISHFFDVVTFGNLFEDWYDDLFGELYDD